MRMQTHLTDYECEKGVERLLGYLPIEVIERPSRPRVTIDPNH